MARVVNIKSAKASTTKPADVISREMRERAMTLRQEAAMLDALADVIDGKKKRGRPRKAAA